MEPQLELAARQLARMRGMNAAYHRRFFSDVRFSVVVILLTLLAGATWERWMFLAVPFLALAGAAQTAFDASYLLFSRQYASRLERYLDDRVGEDVLIAHRLEDAYLFPLDSRKVVTLAFGRGFTWFGFMTLFYTLLGVLAYLVGLGLSLDVLTDHGSTSLAATYLGVLFGLTILAIVVGGWWFVGGEGERRLRTVLDDAFPG
jgi:hypothetical protein